ncbi:major facilitator superfamily domain-containing protein [Aspergillus stella-maris]|uniref:major facilitator superfamily domain-containing protein n=1 Tax=Aspergillus stella-maris TaxID=1810926 RepID=UPI003CCDAC71
MLSEETPLLRPLETRVLSKSVVLGIVSTWIASFTAAADSTITATLSSTIATEFQSLTIISWLGSGYLIALTATQPLSGKLSDIFGRKASFFVAAVVFALGNLLCGLANSQQSLILGRVIAGIGGGGCSSISTFISSDFIPPRSRGLWHSYGTLVHAAGLGCGAVFGGAINDTLGWRWAFIVLAPLSLIAAVAVAATLPQKGNVKSESLRHQLRRIDYAGSITLVLSLAVLFVYLNQEHDSPAASTSGLYAKVAISVSAILLALFIIIELYWAQEPIIPLAIFRSRTVLATCLTVCFVSISYYTMMFYVPLYLQLRGHSPSQTGVLLLPESVGAACGSLTVGLIARKRGSYGEFKLLLLCLLALGATGLTWITQTVYTAHADASSVSVLPELYLFLNGAGSGGMITVTLLALLSAVPYAKQATATSGFLAFRSIGQNLGVSLSGVVFRISLGRPSGDGSDFDGDREAYMHALHATFGLAVVSAGLAFICVLFVKNYKLRSGFEESKDGEGQGRGEGDGVA